MKPHYIILYLCLVFSLAISLYGQNNGAESAPSAVPVASTEKAEKANVEAMKEASITTVRGTIKEISHIISPDTAAYDDCNFTLIIKDDKGVEYLVTVPMFVKRQYTSFARKKAGDNLKVKMIPFDETPEPIQEIQSIDDINDFEHTMYYSDSAINDEEESALFIDPEKKAIWMHQLLEDAEQDFDSYQRNIKDIENELRQEMDGYKRRIFKAKQESYGYFFNGQFFSNTDHYNPTLLQGIIDLQKKCEECHCTLVVVPCVAENEFAKKELIDLAKPLPFVDPGRVQFVIDCLKNNILALDTNKIIRNHLSNDYLPYSMLRDGHFSQMTNLFIADHIATSLDIKRNRYSVKKGYFTMSSVHLPYYSGPQIVSLEPSFDKAFKSNQSASCEVIVAGDSYTSTNNFNSYLSSLTLGNLTTIRHDARANTTLQELLDGKYDSRLKEASLIVFIFSAAYMKGYFPTQDLVDTLTCISRKEIEYSDIPISGSPQKITTQKPKNMENAKEIGAIVYTSPAVARYAIKVNNRTVFEYDCVFQYNGGDNHILLRLSSEDFVDGKVELSIDGNAALSKLVLVDLSDAGTIDSEVKP